jgi:hypothetical protein
MVIPYVPMSHPYPLAVGCIRKASRFGLRGQLSLDFSLVPTFQQRALAQDDESHGS